MNNLPKTSTVLIGNSFPLSLIRRSVRIVPMDKASFLEAVRGKCLLSFWGHTNTLAAVQEWTGLDLTPATERPAVVLSPEGLPCFDGQVFHDCLILSPDYRQGFRPCLGDEVGAENILGWQVLKIIWE